jgi:hypothetical protein
MKMLILIVMAVMMLLGQCSDPEELIYKVIHDRNMDPQNTDIKIGADDGQNILADGSRDKRSKDFQNMRNPPLLKGAPEDLILELVSPPELHLDLGIPDKLTTEMIKNVFPDEKAGKEFMSKFYKKENITVCGKQGGKLEGATRMFLKTTHSLELELRKVSPEVFMKGLPFTRTLKALVVHSCFGAVLLEG